MNYKVYVEPEVKEFVGYLDDKSRRICKDNLKKLEDSPYPGQGIGDKEKIPVSGEEVYRLHISRTFTAFYHIIEEKKQVHVVEILPIDEAHKKYGF